MSEETAQNKSNPPQELRNSSINQNCPERVIAIPLELKLKSQIGQEIKMLNINLNSIQENKIQPRKKVAKVKETVFAKYIQLTLDKLEQSISDANGRYVEGHAYANAKPSQNWKVVKNATSLQDEVVAVWLKVGIKKVAIDGDETIVKVPSSALIAVLEDLKVEIESYRDNPTSDNAKAFHQVAIEQAKPKSKLSKNGNEFTYNSEMDMYVEVA